MKALALFVFWVAVGTIFEVHKMETEVITGVYLSVAAMSTGGLYAPTCATEGDGDWCFAFVGVYCLIGIPVFGYTLGQFATVFTDRFTRAKASKVLARKITQAIN